MIISLEEFLVEKVKNKIVSNSEPKRTAKANHTIINFVSAKLGKNDKGLTLTFTARDPATGSGKEWKQIIKFPKISTDDLDTKKHRLDALNSNMKFECNCPDFLYGGFKYMAWNDKDKFGIKKETIPPNVKNPYRIGYGCKHLAAVISNIEKYEKKLIIK